MQDQLAELRMMIDHDDPMHVEAEAAFAAMVAKIMREAEIAENLAKCSAERLADPIMAKRIDPRHG